MGNNCLTFSKGNSLNNQIEAMNKANYASENQKIKLLLLGAGESGKSTLFKQMRILYGKSDFTMTERNKMKKIIHQNIAYNMSQLLTVDFDVDPSCPVLTPELLVLWNQNETQEKWKLQNRASYQIQDSLGYFLDPANYARIIKEDYIPTNQDILHCRIRTSGIVEEEFEIEGNKFVMVDVGGQRNERKKWIHAFEDIDCIIFITAISEYDQVLFEDNSVSRQKESIDLFSQVVNDSIFKTDAMILFLNKVDLFRKKLLTIPFRDEAAGRNLGYTGVTIDGIGNKDDIEDFENSQIFEEIYSQSLCYVESLYKKVIPSNREVSIHVTCATDTQQIQKIMTSCKEIFLKRNLAKTGFMK